MSPRDPRRGQIVLPALLIFPALLLFVYLIYETAKLSREKIRHQFAMDAAVFVEMANYSDFLNRTAYVNGAFPMRIFQEGYADFPAECEGKWDQCQKTTYAEILYKNGAFPRSAGDPGKVAYDDEGVWDIRYGGAGAGKNSSPPQLSEPFALFTLDDANHYWHSYPLATEIYKLYRQVYSLLGQVEDAQLTVLKRLSADRNFLSKSYWLNTGDPLQDGVELGRRFDVSLGNFMGDVQPVCLRALTYCGNKDLGGGGIQPFAPHCTDPPVALDTSPGCSQGLFQLMHVEPRAIGRLRDSNGEGYPGLSLSMNWAVPAGNYWNVDFAGPGLFGTPSGKPELHTTISLAGDPAARPAVWPDPTPKFQVRQFP
ncbi:MAG: hypothetical protein HY552_03300 [Elusimicrobia bacterium]|nr:hypothetical protein [Elusimicrobiota bacterium]